MYEQQWQKEFQGEAQFTLEAGLDSIVLVLLHLAEPTQPRPDVNWLQLPPAVTFASYDSEIPGRSL